MNWLKERALAIVLPLILAPLAMLLTQWSKRAWAWLDQQHPGVKQAVLTAWASALTALAAAMGKATLCTDGALTCAPETLDWRAVLAWVVAGALALHGWRKRPGN